MFKSVIFLIFLCLITKGVLGANVSPPHHQPQKPNKDSPDHFGSQFYSSGSNQPHQRTSRVQLHQPQDYLGVKFQNSRFNLGSTSRQQKDQLGGPIQPNQGQIAGTVQQPHVLSGSSHQQKQSHSVIPDIKRLTAYFSSQNSIIDTYSRPKLNTNSIQSNLHRQESYFRRNPFQILGPKLATQPAASTIKSSVDVSPSPSSSWVSQFANKFNGFFGRKFQKFSKVLGMSSDKPGIQKKTDDYDDARQNFIPNKEQLARGVQRCS